MRFVLNYVGGILGMLVLVIPTHSLRAGDALRGEAKVLRKEAVVDAPVEKVWWAWTTPEGIASFFSPESKIELRIGGAYELYMSMKTPDESGGRGSEGCKLLAYMPNEMLSFEWTFPPKVMALRKTHAKTQVVLLFDALPGSKTHVRFAQLGWLDGPDWDTGYAYFDNAWGRVMQQLEQRVRGPALDTPALPQPANSIQRQEKLIDAPVADVWRALMTKEGMESWMVAHAEINLRVGGRMRTQYDPQGVIGDPNTIENIILAYEPERMYAIKVGKPPEKFPFKTAVKDLWTVVRMDPVGERQTRVTITGVGYTADEESQKMRAFFERGNQWTLEKLQEKCAGKAASAANRPDPSETGKRGPG